MELLAKLETVKVDNLSRLSPLDQEFCRKQERLYIEAAKLLADTLAKMNEIYAGYTGRESYEKDGYIDLYDDIRKMEERIPKIKDRHIGKVCGYFARKYNVTLDSEKICRKYKDVSPPHPAYQEIVDEIFVQLGGFSFEEKAVSEIKAKFSEHVGGWSKKPEIKGVRLCLPHYVYVDHEKDYSDPRGKRKIAKLHYSASGNLNDLFRALSHFETGRIETAHYYTNFCYQLDRNRREAFGKHELGYNKVQSIRIMQTGKVEIGFESYEQAEMFLKQYYIPQ